MNIRDEYIRLVRAVNEATTEAEHRERAQYLLAWFDGVEAALGRDDVWHGGLVMSADMYYLDQGCERPMCGGIWLDWKAGY